MIRVNNLVKHFPVVSGMRSLFSKSKGKYVKAVDSISFKIESGEVLGLAGESGCGKSTTGRVLLDLDQATSGEVLVDEVDNQRLKKTDRKSFYRTVQMIFQDPYGSINPQHTVEEILAKPLLYQGEKRKNIKKKILDTLELVGLNPPENFLYKHPHFLSGGQRQRLCIGRAIILSPRFLVADEPISMLDVSIKSEILILLKKLVRDKHLSMLYITHDLATVGHICDNLAIMYLGKIVETGPTDKILQHPSHPYTQALVSAVPIPDPTIKREPVEIKGGIPDPINLPSGCRFHPRCPLVDDDCKNLEPPLLNLNDVQRVACHKITAYI